MCCAEIARRFNARASAGDLAAQNLGRRQCSLRSGKSEIKSTQAAAASFSFRLVRHGPFEILFVPTRVKRIKVGWNPQPSFTVQIPPLAADWIGIKSG